MGPRGYSGSDGHTKPGVPMDFDRAAEESAYSAEFIREPNFVETRTSAALTFN